MATKYQDKLTQVQGKLFINGKFVDSQGGELFDVLNPATEEVIFKATTATP